MYVAMKRSTTTYGVNAYIAGYFKYEYEMSTFIFKTSSPFLITICSTASDWNYMPSKNMMVFLEESMSVA